MVTQGAHVLLVVALVGCVLIKQVEQREKVSPRTTSFPSPPSTLLPRVQTN